MWGLEDLSDSDTAAAVQAAVAEPYRYILKPQREGGGNNLYGVSAWSDLQVFARAPTERVLAAWVCVLACDWQCMQHA